MSYESRLPEQGTDEQEWSEVYASETSNGSQMVDERLRYVVEKKLGVCQSLEETVLFQPIDLDAFPALLRHALQTQGLSNSEFGDNWMRQLESLTEEAKAAHSLFEGNAEALKIALAHSCSVQEAFLRGDCSFEGYESADQAAVQDFDETHREFNSSKLELDQAVDRIQAVFEQVNAEVSQVRQESTMNDPEESMTVSDEMGFDPLSTP